VTTLVDLGKTWLAAAPGWLLPTAIAVSAVTVVITIFGLPAVIVRLPDDTFLHPPEHGPWSWRRVTRNAVGGVLLLAGVAMLVLPGQGLLTLFAGLLLTDLPGKRRAELALLRRRPIRAGVDALRRRASAPRLRLPEDVA